MSQFVTDCSVTMCWCFPDETDPYAARVLSQLDANETVVPAIWALEVANALLIGERRQRFTEADSLRFLEVLRALPIIIDDTPLGQTQDDILSLGRRHSLSSYDAAYLELAMREGVPLATLDEKLMRAAKAAGVAIAAP